MLVEITAPASVLGLLENRPLPEGTELEFERTAFGFDSGLHSLVVTGDDVATVTRSLRERPAIDGVTATSDTETVLRLRFDTTMPELLACIRETDGTVRSATATTDTWTFEVRFPSTDASSRFYTRYDDETHPITIRRLNHQGTTDRRSNGQLTADQRDALARAVATGYFEVPRRTTLVELADELDISDTAVSQRIRRGMANVLQDSALASEAGTTTVRNDD